MKRIFAIIISLVLLVFPITSFGAEDSQYVSRAEFVMELLKAFEEELNFDGTTSFTDLNEEIAPYIETANKLGIVKGYGELFRPDDNITKEQALIILVRYINKGEIEDNYEYDLDTTNVSPWAMPYIKYAMNFGLVGEEDISALRVFLTRDELVSLLSKGINIFDELYFREGLSAAEMLSLINDKNTQLESFKQKGDLKANMKFLIEGIPQELSGIESMLGMPAEGIDMEIEIEMQFKSPDKFYIIEYIKAAGIMEGSMEKVEVLMDSNTMYTKIGSMGKWIKQDISALMAQINALSNNEYYNMSQLSKEQLDFFKDYSFYDKDVKIEDKDYYVIKLVLDKDAYSGYFKEVMDQVMDSIVEFQMNDPNFQQIEGFNADIFKEMLMKVVNNMEIQGEYKYYINKETKVFEKAETKQNIMMIMNDFLEPFKDMIEEDISNIILKMNMSMEGELLYYDYNGEVNFPQISEDDIWVQ